MRAMIFKVVGRKKNAQEKSALPGGRTGKAQPDKRGNI